MSYMLLGELIDALEKIRQQQDSAVTVAIEDLDSGVHLMIDSVTYDKKLDRVVLEGGEQI